MPFPSKYPQVIHFFDYIHSDPSDQIRLLEREVRWQHPQNRNMRFDCLLGCFENHRAIQLNHISFKGLICCNLVRDNVMDRSDALASEQDIEDANEQDCRKVFDLLDITKFSMPPINLK
jgi:hypothetical protein